MNETAVLPGSDQAAPARGGLGGWPWAVRILALAAVSAGVLLLAAAAFVLSYPGLHALAGQAGVSASLARLYPLIVDAVLVMAGAAVLALRTAGLAMRAASWLALIVLVAATAAAGAVHAVGTRLPHQAAAVTGAVLPWVLALTGFLLMLAMLRHARRYRRSSRTGPHAHEVREAQAATGGPGAGDERGAPDARGAVTAGHAQDPADAGGDRPAAAAPAMASNKASHKAAAGNGTAASNGALTGTGAAASNGALASNGAAMNGAGSSEAVPTDVVSDGTASEDATVSDGTASEAAGSNVAADQGAGTGTADPGDPADALAPSQHELAAAQEDTLARDGAAAAQDDPEPARDGAAAAQDDPEPARDGAAAAQDDPEPARDGAAAAQDDPEPARDDTTGAAPAISAEEDLAAHGDEPDFAAGDPADEDDPTTDEAIPLPSRPPARWFPLARDEDNVLMTSLVTAGEPAGPAAAAVPAPDAIPGEEPAQETPVRNAPVQETPAQETPAQETAAQETPARRPRLRRPRPRRLRLRRPRLRRLWAGIRRRRARRPRRASRRGGRAA